MYKKTHVFALYYIIIIIKFVTNIYNDTDKQYIYNKLQDNTRDWNVEQLPKHILDIENNTWVRGNTRFISSVEHDIMFNTRNKSGISKHPCIFLFII